MWLAKNYQQQNLTWPDKGAYQRLGSAAMLRRSGWHTMSDVTPGTPTRLGHSPVISDHHHACCSQVTFQLDAWHSFVLGNGVGNDERQREKKVFLHTALQENVVNLIV